jgi:hypothetical protein
VLFYRTGRARSLFPIFKDPVRARRRLALVVTGGVGDGRDLRRAATSPAGPDCELASVFVR